MGQVNVLAQMKKHKAVRYDGSNFIDENDSVIPGGGGGALEGLFELTYSNVTTPGDAGDGVIRFDSVDLASATICYVDNLSNDNLGLGLISAGWQVGGILTARAKSGRRYFSGIITSLAAPTGHKVIGVTRIGHVNFNNGEEVILEYVGPGVPMNPGSGANAPAYEYTFSTTTTQANPGAGGLRLDNGTQGSAVNMVLSATDADGNDITAILASIGRNFRVRFKSANPSNSNYLELKTKTVVNNTTHFSVNYTRIGGKSFANGETVLMTFFAESEIYLDPADNRLKRSNDGLVLDGSYQVADIAAALSDPGLDETVAANDGVSAIVIDPGVNGTNPLLETFPWSVKVNYAKNKLQHLSGVRLVKLIKPFRVVIPADGLTWTVSNQSGKVRIAAASHLVPAGFDAAACAIMPTYLMNKTAQNGWAANSLHRLLGVSGNNVDLDTAFASQGNPDFYAPGEKFRMLAINIPALRDGSFVEGRMRHWMIDSASAKTLELILGSAFSIWAPAAAGLNDMAGVNRDFEFTNYIDNAASPVRRQVSSVVATNAAAQLGTIAGGSRASGTENTGVSTVLGLDVTLASAGDWFEITDMDVGVVW